MLSKKRSLIGFGVYLLIFISLMVIATFFDLPISKLLATNTFNEGGFYTKNFIGGIVEVIGSFPIFIAILFATLVMSRSFLEKKGARKLFSIFFILGSVIDLTWFIKDTFKYASRIYGFTHIYEKDYMMIIYIVLAIGLTVVAHVVYNLFRKIDNENLKKFARVILFAALFHLLIEIIKGPVGRMRFRAMNMINDFSNFTPWYVISSAKETVLKIYPSLPGDSFKSFPSGHTNAAGLSYVLICLPDLFKRLNKRKYRILFYIIPIVYTGFVAFYRIRVGAHFMSDVVFGGTLAFTTVSIFRYVFILRKKN